MQDMLTTNQKVSGGHVAPAVQNQGHFGAVRGRFVGFLNWAAKRLCMGLWGDRHAGAGADSNLGLSIGWCAFGLL
jgi:hypothetical protein